MELSLRWYRFLVVLFAGVVLANSVPHLVNGIAGEPFPSPFAEPAGFEDSPPLTNVLGGSANLAVGYALLRYPRVRPADSMSMLVRFAGAVVMAVVLSQGFSHRVG